MKKHNEISYLKADLLDRQGATDMTNIKTDRALIDRLRQAANSSLTAEEIQNQRISYILGTLKDNNSVSRDRIKQILQEHEGELKVAS